MDDGWQRLVPEHQLGRDADPRRHAVVLARDGRDVCLRRAVVAECLAQLRDALIDRALGHHQAGSDRVEQLFRGDNLAGATREHDQQPHLARLQFLDLAVAGDLVGGRIDDPVPEPEAAVALRQVRNRRRVSGFVAHPGVRKSLIRKNSENRKESISPPSGLRGGPLR